MGRWDNETKNAQLIQGEVYTSTTTGATAATADNLWLVAGGAIEIVSCFAQCTVVFAGAPGDMKLNVDATAGADYDMDLTTSVTVDTLGLGDVVRFTNAIDKGVLTLTADSGAGQTLSWFCPAGLLIQTLTSTGTGAVKWYLTFRVLDEGVTVTAQ